jgi:hypothetical protein
VLGALDGVVGHLALDDARVGALAARAEQLEEQLVPGLVMSGVQGLRGKNRLL